MSIVEIEFSVLQQIFDTAIDSENFNAGILNKREVEALRECAVILKMDPAMATPENFKFEYKRLEVEKLGGIMKSDEAYLERFIINHPHLLIILKDFQEIG